MAKRIVRMLKPYASHNPGEVCGFDVFEAAALVLRGLAAWRSPEDGQGAPEGPLPPLRTMLMGGLQMPVAPNVAADAAFLRARFKE